MNLDIDKFKDEFLRSGYARLQLDYPLNSKSFLELGKHLGAPLKTDRHSIEDGFVQIVAKDEMFGDAELGWHSDYSFARGQFDGTLLYNDIGGESVDTVFCDLRKLLASLSATEHMSLEGIRAQYKPPSQFESCFNEQQQRAIERLALWRPILGRHRLTGEEMLYYSPATANKIEPEVDLTWLEERYDKFAFHHHWRPHELLAFDNLRFSHRRPALKSDRRLFRMQFRYV